MPRRNSPEFFFPRYGAAHGHAQEPTPGSAVEHCRFLDTGRGGYHVRCYERRCECISWHKTAYAWGYGLYSQSEVWNAGVWASTWHSDIFLQCVDGWVAGHVSCLSLGVMLCIAFSVSHGGYLPAEAGSSTPGQHASVASSSGTLLEITRAGSRSLTAHQLIMSCILLISHPKCFSPSCPRPFIKWLFRRCVEVRPLLRPRF